MSLASILDRAAKKATPEAQARIKHLRNASLEATSTHPLTPEQVAARDAAQADIAWSVHGILVDRWQCSCGQPYRYPSSFCQGCKRPYPRKCIQPGCGEINHPVDAMTADGQQAFVRVQEWCEPCRNDRRWDPARQVFDTLARGRKSRAASFARSNIPPKERAIAPGFVPYEQQVLAITAIDEWAESRATWQHEQNPDLTPTTVLFIGGKPGRGKGCVAARAVHRIFVDLGLVSSFRWHSQAELAVLFQERFARETELSRARADQAMHEWRAITDSPLLVIDDMFTAPLTPAFGAALGTLIRERLDHNRKMIITANLRPQWSVHFPDDVGRIDSRWGRNGREVVIAGEDLRQVAA